MIASARYRTRFPSATRAAVSPRPRRVAACLAAGALALSSLGCADDPAAVPAPSSTACDPGAAPTRTASCVEAFTPGDGAGWGMDEFPDILYGEPRGAGLAAGGLDVLSLGKLGEIVVGFGGNEIVDGAGVDFLVFENAFYVNGDPAKIFKELGEVSVSEDGVTWHPFPCHVTALPHDGYEGCAGWHPILANPDDGVSAFDPSVAGGDPFDLADLGLARAKFVRIKDLSGFGAADNAGFDLDAVAIVNPAR